MTRFGLESHKEICKVRFELSGLLLFELLNSSVWREVAFCIDRLEGLDFFVGLLIVGDACLGTPIAKLPLCVSVKGAILGHEVTHSETSPSSGSKSKVERGVKLCRAL